MTRYILGIASSNDTPIHVRPAPVAIFVNPLSTPHLLRRHHACADLDHADVVDIFAWANQLSSYLAQAYIYVYVYKVNLSPLNFKLSHEKKKQSYFLNLKYWFFIHGSWFMKYSPILAV